MNNLARDFDVDSWLSKDLERYTQGDWEDTDSLTGTKNPNETERARVIRDIVMDCEKNHACSSCPHKKGCDIFVHSNRDAFTKVSGCSYHPDQSKYEGHSTEVTITDTTKSDRKQITWAAWSSNWNATAATSSTSAGVLNGVDFRASDGWYVIYRACLVHDTSTIPSTWTTSVLSAKYQVYHNTKLTVSRQAIVQLGIVEQPKGAGALADYYKDIYSRTVAVWPYTSNNYPENQYVDVTISDLSCIVQGGTTRNSIRTTEDVWNGPVGGGSNYNGYYNLQGYAAANPPKLVVTYDTLSTTMTFTGLLS